MLVPLLGALAALVVAAGAFIVLRGGGEQFGSPDATYRDSLTRPHRVAGTRPHGSEQQPKIDEQARALGLGSGPLLAVEPQPGVVAEDSGGGPTPEQLAA